MLTYELQVQGRGKELTGNGLEVDLLVLPKQFPPTADQSQIHEHAGAFLIQTIAGACSDPAEYRLGMVLRPSRVPLGSGQNAALGPALRQLAV